MNVTLVDEIARIARQLGRHATASRVGSSEPKQYRVEQTCPICGLLLNTLFACPDPVDGAWLHRMVFSLYDDHRCVSKSTSVENLQAMLARTESESQRLAARASELATLEAEVPDEINLFVRAEREFVVLAEWMAHIEALLRAKR